MYDNGKSQTELCACNNQHWQNRSKKHSSVKTDDGEVITARQIKKPQKKNAALDLKKLFYIHATLKKG